MKSAPQPLKIVMLLFTLAGLGILMVQAFRWWTNDRDFSADGRRQGMSLALLLVMGIMVSLALMTPLDWDRYYLPPVVLVSLCTAVSLGSLMTQLWSRIVS